MVSHRRAIVYSARVDRAKPPRHVSRRRGGAGFRKLGFGRDYVRSVAGVFPIDGQRRMTRFVSRNAAANNLNHAMCGTNAKQREFLGAYSA